MADYRVTLNSDGINRDFIFVGGPLDSPVRPDELFRALGAASAQWARLEQHIDAVLIQVNNRQHSATLFKEDHPVSFQAKIKLLKRWFNQHPALANLTDDVRTLTTKLKEISQHRNNIVHGALEKWDADTETCVLRTLKSSGDEFSISTHEYTIDGIDTVSDLTAMCNRYLSEITKIVFTKDSLAQLRTP